MLTSGKIVLMPVNALSLSLSVLMDKASKDNGEARTISFFDNNSTINGKQFRGHPISIVEPHTLEDAEVIVCSYRARKAILSQLEQMQPANPAELHTYEDVVSKDDLDNLLQALAEIQIEELQHISDAHCESVSGQGDLAIKTALLVDKGNQAVVNLLSFVITERCSLLCKNCVDWMQYYESPVTFETDEIINGFHKLLDAVDCIQHIGIQGGEPLIHKQLPAIVSAVCDTDKVGYANIITNGTILPKEELLHTMLKYDNIAFRISDYGGISKKRKEIEELCNHYHVKCITLRDMTWYFGPVIEPVNTDYESVRQKYATCQMNCAGLAKNLFSKCQNALFAYLLKAIPPNLKGEASVMDLNSPNFSKLDMIKHLNSNEPLQACWICSGKMRHGQVIPTAEQTRTLVPYVKYE